MKLSRFALVLILVPCLGLVACAEQADEGEAEAMEETGAMEMASIDMETLGAEMTEMANAWEQAYEGGNAAALAGLYAEDAYYMAPYSEAIRGSAAIETYLTGMMEQTDARDITIQRTDFGGNADLSYAIGTYTVEMQMAGAEEPVTDNGKYMTLAKRGADGSWKIHAHIWNTNRSEAEVVQELSAMAEAAEMSEPEM